MTEPFLSIGNVPVYFSQDWGVGIGGGLWSTGLAIARYFQTDHARELFQRLVVARGRRPLSVLELGSGNGFLSLCLLALAKSNPGILKELVITDTKDHLALINKTLTANQHVQHHKGANETCHVMEHVWSEFAPTTDSTDFKDKVQEGRHKFDLILGSDVAYHERLYDPLIASLQRYSHEKTVSLIGVTMADTKPDFFRLLRQAGFRYRRLADHLMDPEFRGNTFGIFLIDQEE